MCGLAGFLNVARNQTADEMLSIVGRMADTLLHRGPDDVGTWCDAESGIALGFRRLSILDLSPLGHQPMTSSCGRFVMAFNGEIYNHHELRDELAAEGRPFRGRSDTEVLVEGFAEWGIEPTIKRCIGMFAIAAWDNHRQELTVVRDRLGKKPLYVAKCGPTILFGSELKALRAHPAFTCGINRNAISEFLRQSYLSSQSIYLDAMPLRPGTSITIKLSDDQFWSNSRMPRQKEYWSFQQVVTNGKVQPFAGSYDEAVDRLDQLLTDAVGRRMVADVPLGAFLSGGIDSSLVVALMQKQSSRPVKTFTIGFEEEAYNEAPFARQVARHLKTDHTEIVVTSKEALDVIPLLPQLFDEPFGDSSEIPTYLVSHLARRHVTVALSGDGGDELFCGYRRYFEALDPFSATDSTKRSAFLRIARVLHSMPPFIRTSFGRACQVAGRLPLGRLATLFSRASDVLNEKGPNDRYLRNMSHWRDLDKVVVGLSHTDRDTLAILTDEDPSLARRAEVSLNFDEATTSARYQQSWQAYDTLNYLPGDILTKVDRASMGVSLEARTPLLDHRVVEFAWSLPHAFKVQGRSGKRILRDVLAKYIPRELFERPKVGFGVPIGDWLRGPLRDWAENLINEARLKREGFFNPQPIRQKWTEHLQGRVDWCYLLWDVLMFQAWLEKYPVA